MALGVGHGHQVDKVLDQKLDVAVSPVKWLSWVSEFFLVFHIQFYKINNNENLGQKLLHYISILVWTR